MKRLHLIPILLLCLCLCSCGKQDTEIPDHYKTFECSNLAEKETQAEIASAMTLAGIPKSRQEVFFHHVSQFNRIMKPDQLLQGFEEVALSGLPKYDPYELQDTWTEAYPDFMGYNCRLTAYGLFRDFTAINEAAEKNDLFLAFDLAAIEEDASLLSPGGSADEFRVLFSTAPATKSANIADQVKTLQDYWKKQGVQFLPSESVSLITFILHDNPEDGLYELFVGHTGILIEADKDSFYFVEKVAFQEPYQVVRVENRYELNDYLMGKYSSYAVEGLAPPFIMENDQLMEGYRALPAEE